MARACLRRGKQGVFAWGTGEGLAGQDVYWTIDLRVFFNVYIKHHNACNYLSESPGTESLHVLGQDALKIDVWHTWCAELWSCLLPALAVVLWSWGTPWPTHMGNSGISFLGEDVSGLILFQYISVHLISFILVKRSVRWWCSLPKVDVHLMGPTCIKISG